MGKKRGNNWNNTGKHQKRKEQGFFSPVDMDDEIDAFHKERDVIPLDANDDVGDSDENDEYPVFELKDNDEDEDDDDDYTDIDNDPEIAKIKRQKKYLQAKLGGVDEEMDDDDDDKEVEGDPDLIWSKKYMHGNDSDDAELNSEELDLKEEEAVIQMQKKKAESLSVEDFGLEDVNQDEDDGDPTIEEILVKGKGISKSSGDKKAEDGTGVIYEVKKDLNELSREEKMDVVYSSAPELVGLLSELNAALEQLETKVIPLSTKVNGRENVKKGGMSYLEVKQLLLLAYCQAITFYLLLKSEGQPVRDHPVIARLVELKYLLDKMNQLDKHLPPELEKIFDEEHGAEKIGELVKENSSLAYEFSTNDYESSLVPAKIPEAAFSEKPELVKTDSLKDCENKGGKRQSQNGQVGVQSMEMLKVRAALEDKLRQKCIFGSAAMKPDRAQKHIVQPMNEKLETLDDFDDDIVDIRGPSNGQASLWCSSKLSQLVAPKAKRSKVISGDDDLPKRDDIGERRRKHELSVLARAGINSEDDPSKYAEKGDADIEASESEGSEGSEDEFYQQVKRERIKKIAEKAVLYPRISDVPSMPETVDGKRQITYQMEKNRGLTRSRKKETKNPRKKYKLKHKDAEKRRGGQVRKPRTAIPVYHGEASGINTAISRSIRFKN